MNKVVPTCQQQQYYLNKSTLRTGSELVEHKSTSRCITPPWCITPPASSRCITPPTLYYVLPGPPNSQYITSSTCRFSLVRYSTYILQRRIAKVFANLLSIDIKYFLYVLVGNRPFMPVSRSLSILRTLARDIVLILSILKNTTRCTTTYYYQCAPRPSVYRDLTASSGGLQYFQERARANLS